MIQWHDSISAITASQNKYVLILWMLNPISLKSLHITHFIGHCELLSTLNIISLLKNTWVFKYGSSILHKSTLSKSSQCTVRSFLHGQNFTLNLDFSSYVSLRFICNVLVLSEYIQYSYSPAASSWWGDQEKVTACVCPHPSSKVWHPCLPRSDPIAFSLIRSNKKNQFPVALPT